MMSAIEPGTFTGVSTLPVLTRTGITVSVPVQTNAVGELARLADDAGGAAGPKSPAAAGTRTAISATAAIEPATASIFRRRRSLIPARTALGTRCGVGGRS